MNFTKRDLIYSTITGLTAGVFGYFLLRYLGVKLPLEIPLISLIVLVPIIWICGVNLGYFLGRWFSFFNQFGKFVTIGFTNATVDFGVLNLVIYYSGVTSANPYFSLYYALFKGCAFIAANSHSYLWNKFWVFNAGESHGGELEFGKFFGISMVSLLINAGLATAVVAYCLEIGLSDKLASNLGGAAGSGLALIFNFVSLKFLVFKQKNV